MLRIIYLFLVVMFALPTLAENGVNSPYTRYGFGQLSLMETGANKGMGGTGIGLQNRSQINMLNPASYAAVDTLTFLLDVGMSMHNANFAENGVKMNARNTTFDYLAMQFRLLPKLGMTVGMLPFSNIGYNFSNTQVVSNDADGVVTTTNRYYGEGGLRQVVVGLGWSPLNGLSLGVNGSYFYGDVCHYVYNQYSGAVVDTYTKQYLAAITTYNVEFGMQYQALFGKNRIILGATYQLGHGIDDKGYIINSTTTNTSVSNDTLSTSTFYMPASMGVGLSYTYDDRLTFAADYREQQYGAADFFGMKGVDCRRVSVGMEYVPEHISRELFKRARYRAGLHYATSHYTIGGNPGPTEYGATIGIGLPVMNRWNGKSIVNISGQAVHVRGIITENYLRLSVGLSFNEAWFDKWKVQ